MPHNENVMQTSLPATLFESTRYKPAASLLLSLVLAGTSLNARAQGQHPSGSISASGAGPYTYSLSFADAAGATSPIGSIWYAWTATTPPFFYLPGAPSNIVTPFGWTSVPQGNSIQFIASSSIYDIAPGSSLSGFSYMATFTPAQLAGTANSGLSVAYSGGIEASPDFAGVQFTVQTVPEPGTVALLALGGGALAMIRRRQSRSRSDLP